MLRLKLPLLGKNNLMMVYILFIKETINFAKLCPKCPFPCLHQELNTYFIFISPVEHDVGILDSGIS